MHGGRRGRRNDETTRGRKGGSGEEGAGEGGEVGEGVGRGFGAGVAEAVLEEYGGDAGAAGGFEVGVVVADHQGPVGRGRGAAEGFENGDGRV